MAVSPIFWLIKKNVPCADPEMTGCTEWNYLGIIGIIVLIIVIWKWKDIKKKLK